MAAKNERTFTVTTVDGKTVEIARRKEHLYLDGMPTACITPDLSGTVHIFTGLPGWTIRQLRRYVFSGSTFWDILYDVPPTKDFAGQLQAMLMQVQQMTQLFVDQLPEV